MPYNSNKQFNNTRISKAYDVASKQILLQIVNDHIFYDSV